MILKGNTERDSVNITDPGTSHTFGSLERDLRHVKAWLQRENEAKKLFFHSGSL